MSLKFGSAITGEQNYRECKAPSQAVIGCRTASIGKERKCVMRCVESCRWRCLPKNDITELRIDPLTVAVEGNGARKEIRLSSQTDGPSDDNEKSLHSDVYKILRTNYIMQGTIVRSATWLIS